MPTFAYVADSNLVSVYDISTNKLVTIIKIETIGLNGTKFLAITPNGRYLYVTNLANIVSVIETCTNSVIDTITVGNSPEGIAITPDGKFAYVANYNSNNVSVIDTGTNTVISSIPSGVTPSGIAITPDGFFAYVTNPKSDSVSVIEIAANTVVDTITVGDFPQGIVITPNGRFAYVANQGQSAATDKVSVIDLTTNTVVDTITVGLAPTMLAVTPNGKFVYVTNAISNNVSVIETAANSVIDTIQVEKAPLGIAITPDGSFVYVSNFGANSITVINTDTNAVVDRIAIGANPIGIAIANITESKVDLTIIKTDFPDPVKLGDLIIYTIPIKNNGPCTASGVTIFDTLPEGVEFISAISTQGTCSASFSGVTCDIGTLEKGKTVTVTITVKPKATGTFCNKAVVSANEADSDESNNTVFQCTTVLDSACIETKRVFDTCAFQEIKQKAFILPCIFRNKNIQCEIIKSKCWVLDIIRIDEHQVNAKIRIKVFLKIKNCLLYSHVRVVYFDQTSTLTSPEGTDVCCELTDAVCEFIQTNDTEEETLYNRFFDKLSFTIQVNGVVKSTRVTQLEVALLGYCDPRPCQCPAGWLKAGEYYEIQFEDCSTVKSITVEWEDKNTGGSAILDLNGMLYGPPIDIPDTLNTYSWNNINALVCTGKIKILSGCAHITKVTVGEWIPVAPGASYPLPSSPSEISKINFEAKTDPGTISVVTATGYSFIIGSITVTEFEEQFELNLGDVYPIEYVELINKGISTVYISDLTTE